MSEDAGPVLLVMSEAQPSRAARVAVFHSVEEIATSLLESLTSVGFFPVVLDTSELKNGRVDWDTFLSMFQPDMVVYDLGPPFRPNWTFFQLVRGNAALLHLPFVLTTQNRRALERVIHGTGALELTGEDDEIVRVVEAVTQTCRPRSLPSTVPLRLSEQERRILTLLVDGSSNQEIARSLGLSSHTIRTYLTGIFRKLNARNRAEAVSIYIKSM